MRGASRFLLSLILTSTVCLAGCATSATGSYCPVNVYPDECALEWFEKTATPACVDDYLARLERQQRAIKAACQ
jgi:hypothetical protein